jgi:hypothetical protein
MPRPSIVARHSAPFRDWLNNGWNKKTDNKKRVYGFTRKPLILFGAPGRDRTPDPQLRRLLLYPTELLARNNHLYCTDQDMVKLVFLSKAHRSAGTGHAAIHLLFSPLRS